MHTKQEAFGLIVTSPVMRPTSGNSSNISRYFWLLRALIGEVYTTRCLSRSDIAIAYSATTVFPADVWADTCTHRAQPVHDYGETKVFSLKAQKQKCNISIEIHLQLWISSKFQGAENGIIVC